MRRVAAWAACCALLAAAGCGSGGESGTTTSAHAGSAWPAPNADASNTRRVGGPVDADSVARLRPAWSLRIGAYVASPIVLDGVAYVQDLDSSVYAVDVATGSVRWKRPYDEGVIGPNGVAVVGERVYGATATRVFALDRDDGRPLWSRRIAFRDGEGIDMAPGVADGTVYVSTVPVTTHAVYQAGVRGTLWALDAATGAPRWKWQTVPDDLWGRPDVNSGGGLWYPPAFDGAGGVYAAVGNPAPYTARGVGALGRSRPGPNRWTNSIVKLDADSGRVVWARQVLPHDLYDWDLQCPPILRVVDGRRIVVVGGKMGFVYAFDRESGEPLWRRAVGVHNGHDRDNLLAMRGTLTSRPAGTRVLPGVFGGIETQMAADDDTVYAPVVDQYTVYDGGLINRNQAFEEATGEVVAISLADGSVRWTRKLPHGVFGGATVVNDLLLTTTFDGTVWALDTRTGAVVWKHALGQPTVSTVEVAGDLLITAESIGYGSPATLHAFRLG